MMNNRHIPYIEELTPQTEDLRLPHFAYYEHEITLETCIYQIENMPDLVINYQHDIILDFSNKDDDEKLIEIVRKQYRNTAYWLKYYLLSGGDKLLPELTITDKQHYKTFAELSLAKRKLVKEISAYTCWKYQQYLSSDNWWLACEQELCEQALTKAGYLGEPEPIGCVNFYNQTVQRGKDLNSQKAELVEANVSELHPLQALEGLGRLIARKDSRFSKHWEDYKRAINRNARALKESPLNPMYLIGGKIQKSARGRDWRGKPKQPVKICKDFRFKFPKVDLGFFKIYSYFNQPKKAE